MANGFQDLHAAAVVERHVDCDAVVVLRQLHRLFDPVSQVGRKRVQAAHVVKTHAVLVQLLQLAVDEVSDQPDQRIHLSPGPDPVLRGEREEREHRHFIHRERLNHPPDVLGAGAVPRLARYAVLLSPAPVAIHDDGDVLGQLGQLYKRSILRDGCNDHLRP